MPTIGPLHHHKPGTEAGRLACSEQRSICLSVSTTHASFAGEVQWNVSVFRAVVSVCRSSNPMHLVAGFWLSNTAWPSCGREPLSRCLGPWSESHVRARQLGIRRCYYLFLTRRTSRCFISRIRTMGCGQNPHPDFTTTSLKRPGQRARGQCPPDRQKQSRCLSGFRSPRAPKAAAKDATRTSCTRSEPEFLEKF